MQQEPQQGWYLPVYEHIAPRWLLGARRGVSHRGVPQMMVRYSNGATLHDCTVHTFRRWIKRNGAVLAQS